jgi:hypothetical protein
LTKLAIHFSVTNPLIDLSLVSMPSIDIVKENVNYLNDLDENENITLQEIRKNIFIPLNYKGYGDLELVSYRKKI